MGSMESAARRDSSSDSQRSSIDSSQDSDTDEEGLSVQNHVQQWERREPTSRSRGQSPLSPEDPDTDEERSPVQMCGQQWEESRMWSAAERDPESCFQERLSVQDRIQQWQSMGSSVQREPTSRSRRPSPHSRQNAHQWEESCMWSAAESDPASRSQGSSADSSNIPASEGETLSAQRRLEMWEQCVTALSTHSRALEQSIQGEPTEGSIRASQEEASAINMATPQLEESTGQGPSACSKEGPSKEETEVLLRRQLEQITVKLQEQIEANQSLEKTVQDLEQSATKKNADLQKQLEEEKMQNEAQCKEIERQDERLLKEREESEVKNHSLTIAQSKIVELHSDLQTQCQTNTDLQQQLSSANAAIAELRDTNDAWRQTMQEEKEKKEGELKETIAKMREAIEELHGDLQFRRQTNTDLQQQLSSANAAIAELRDTNDAWRQAVQEEREKKEGELTETIAKMQEAIEELHGDLQFQRQTNTDLQQQLRSAKAAIAELIDADEAWRQTVQEVREKKEGELKETIAKLQEAIEELHGDLQFQRQTNTDLQQQLSSANTAITELRDADEWLREAVQEEREWKDRELMETIAKIQEVVNRQEQQESELEMFREEKRRKEERKRRRWWRRWWRRFFRRN